jgi:O-antigen/teichoic acid export membrane protein
MISTKVILSIRGVSLFLLPMLFGVALYSDSIIGLLFGHSYSFAATDPVFLVTIAAYCSALASVVGALIVGKGRMWLGLGLNTIWATAFLVLTFVLVPRFGATGLAAVLAISYCLHLGISFAVSGRLLGVNLGIMYGIAASALLVMLVGYATTVVLGFSSWMVKAILLCGCCTLLVYRERELLSSSGLFGSIIPKRMR